MDGSTIGAAASITQGFSAIADMISGLSFIAGLGLGLKAALSFKAHSETPHIVPISTPMTLAIMGGLMLGLPTFLKVTMETMTPIEAPATLAVNAERTAEPKPLAKAEQPKIVEKAVENPVAAPAPIKIDTLATPEEARAAADRKAIFEVLFGVALALAAGAAAWIAARRRRLAAPSEALPEVQFLDGGSKGGFDSGDIFAKTAVFDKAKSAADKP